MDAFATPDEAPLRALTGRAMSEPRVPGKGNSQRTAVIQINDELIARHPNPSGTCRCLNDPCWHGRSQQSLS